MGVPREHQTDAMARRRVYQPGIMRQQNRWRSGGHASQGLLKVCAVAIIVYSGNVQRFSTFVELEMTVA